MANISCYLQIQLIILVLVYFLGTESRRIEHFRRNRDRNNLLGMLVRTDPECETDGRVESDDPCEICRCYRGRKTCQRKVCDYQPKSCVDSQSQESGCCADFVCPNGPNCYHNGEIINGKELHQEFIPETGCVIMCSCPPPWRVRYDDETQAECTEHCPPSE